MKKIAMFTEKKFLFVAGVILALSNIVLGLILISNGFARLPNVSTSYNRAKQAAVNSCKEYYEHKQDKTCENLTLNNIENTKPETYAAYIFTFITNDKTQDYFYVYIGFNGQVTLSGDPRGKENLYGKEHL